MTKMKSKKMAKSTFAIIIMGIVMVAMLAFGGTFAYFTATAKDTKATATLGTVRITNTGAADNASQTITKDIVLPGETILAETDYKLENKSDVATYVFIKVEVLINDKADDVTTILDIVYPATSSDWEEVEDHAGVYCRKDTGAVAEGAVGISVKVKDGLQDRWVDGATASTKGYMGAKVSVTLTASAIQQKGYENDVKGAYEAIASQTLA